jgi:hypothetical protein
MQEPAKSYLTIVPDLVSVQRMTLNLFIKLERCIAPNMQTATPGSKHVV